MDPQTGKVRSEHEPAADTARHDVVGEPTGYLGEPELDAPDVPSDSDAEPDSELRITDELERMGLFEAREIGRGGFGVVYRCAQRALDRVVAVKVLSSELDGESRERFLREEQAMGRLSGHPNIVDVLQVDVTPGGLSFLVMPYAAHGSLEQLIHDHGPLSWADSLRVGVKLAGAVESAHRVRVLHRDVKPANVLLSRYGEPQLTDFGIARVSGGFQTSSSMITGSPAFTAPEVLKGGKPTVRSDVYGLGATLFALLTGHAAYERQSGEKVVAQFLRITTQPIPDLREQDIPADVAAVIEAAMSSDPAERPASALLFGQMLQQVQRAHGRAVDEMALLDGVGDEVPRDTVIGESTSGPLPSLRTPGPPTVMSRSATLPPTAATKYRPPTPAREPIPRPRLLDILRAGGRRRLAVIHGPAGFGKSTVATQWCAELTAQQIPVAWIGIDHDDDNEVWLLAHLVQAIRRVVPGLGAGLDQVLEERAGEAVPYVISTLIDEIHADGQVIVVVVENWDRIADDGAHGVLDALLDNGCHHLRFVITTREQAGLPMSRTRVRDELVEIGSDELRLTTGETRRILLDRHNLHLTDQQIEQIHTATDGWPAAIQLVSLSLRGSAPGAPVDPDRLIAHLSGGNHTIRQYLAENVLDTIEPRMLEFLMSISVTETVNAGLAAAVSGEADAEQLLEEALASELFLTRLGDDPGWFRIQPLFAEQLRDRLERVHPGRMKSLHRKASRWYAEHQQLRKSVDHAMAATDLKLAVDLVESGGMDLIDTSRLATLFGTVSKLPMQQVGSRSKLLMALARANVNLQQSVPARSALGRLSNMLGRSAEADGEDVRDRCGAEVLEAADLVGHDRTEGVLEKVRPCLDRADELPAWTVSTAANLVSYVRFCDFDFEGARAVQRWAQPYHVRVKDPLVTVLGLLNTGAVAYELLEIDTAAEYFEQARRVGRDRAGPRSRAVRVAAALLGELAYRRGDLDTADRLLEQSHELPARFGALEFMIGTAVTGARVKAALGDIDTALARLDEGDRMAAEQELPRLAAHVRAERLRLDPGAAPAAQTSAPDLGRLSGTAALTAEAEEIAAVRSALARHHRGLGTGPSARAALESTVGRARTLHDRMVEKGRPRVELDMALLLAETLAAAGRADEAVSTLHPVLGRCAELGWTRPILDSGPELIALLGTLSEREFAEIPREFLNSLR